MTTSSERDLRDAARALGLRLAAAGGCSVALLALWHHVPVWLASLQGAAALLALALVARLGAFALGRALELDRRARATREEARP